MEWGRLCNSGRSETPYNNGKAQTCLEAWQAKYEAWRISEMKVVTEHLRVLTQILCKRLDPNESFVTIPFEWGGLCNSGHSKTPYNNGKVQTCLEAWQAKYKAEHWQTNTTPYRHLTEAGWTEEWQISEMKVVTERLRVLTQIL